MKVAEAILHADYLNGTHALWPAWILRVVGTTSPRSLG